MDHNSENRVAQDAPLMKYGAAWRERQLENRIESYMFAVFRNSGNYECNMTQTNLAKCLKIRRQTFVDALERLIERGRIERLAKPNGNRHNPRFGYSWGKSASQEMRDSLYSGSNTDQDIDQDSYRSGVGDSYVGSIDHYKRSPVEIRNLDPNKGHGFFAKNPFDF
jgi:hypothetical protein